MGRKWGRRGVLVLGVVLAVRLAGNVWGLVKNTGRVSRVKLELAEAKKENEELGRRLEYVKSDEFVEREVREKLGLGMPGEVAVILPDQKEQESRRAGEQENEPNWRKWWKLYVGH